MTPIHIFNAMSGASVYTDTFVTVGAFHYQWPQGPFTAVLNSCGEKEVGAATIDIGASFATGPMTEAELRNAARAVFGELDRAEAK